MPACVWSSKQAVVDVAVTVSLAADMSVNLFFQSFVLNVSSSDSLLISVAGMAVYTGYVFMPQHIMAILHYFEVVQWHEGRAHQPTGPVCLWLPVHPSHHLPAGLSVFGAWGRDCFQPGRASSSLLLFQSWLISKVKTLNVVLCWRSVGRCCSLGLFPLHSNIWDCEHVGCDALEEGVLDLFLCPNWSASVCFV